MLGYNFKEGDYLHVLQSYNRTFEKLHVMPNIHRHAGVEIMYVLSGKAIVPFFDETGKEVERFNLSAGDFFLLDSGRFHRLYTADRVTQIVNVEVSASGKQQFAYQRTVYQMTQGDKRLADFFAEGRTFRLFDNGELLLILQMILHKFPKGAGEAAELEALLTILFAEVAEQYKQNVLQYRGYAYVRNAVGEIENDIAGITPDRLAQATGISRVYLQKLFKTCFGMGIADYINRFRLSRAQAYLKRNTSAQIGEVAKEFGFHSMLHFERVFKKVCGCSPRDYREQMRAGREFWAIEKTTFANEETIGAYEGGRSLAKNEKIIQIL